MQVRIRIKIKARFFDLTYIELELKVFLLSETLILRVAQADFSSGEMWVETELTFTNRNESFSF